MSSASPFGNHEFVEPSSMAAKFASLDVVSSFAPVLTKLWGATPAHC